MFGLDETRRLTGKQPSNSHTNPSSDQAVSFDQQNYKAVEIVMSGCSVRVSEAQTAARFSGGGGMVCAPASAGSVDCRCICHITLGFNSTIGDESAVENCGVLVGEVYNAPRHDPNDGRSEVRRGLMGLELVAVPKPPCPVLRALVGMGLVCGLG